MPRFIPVIFAAVVSLSSDAPVGAAAPSLAARAPDIEALLTAARGAPPLICAIAARSLQNSGWSRADAPASPLGDALRDFEPGPGRTLVAPEDVDRVVAALDSDDACVQEMAVRLAARSRDDRVVAAFTSRLAAPAPDRRALAAMGLGLTDTERAVDPLIRALRDDAPPVRANAAWALGRIEDGRALQALHATLGDRDPMVRAAAVGAVGQLDSLSSVAALARILKGDDVPSVRRVAAWALGELESRDAVAPLAAALRGDRDARVREMSAWALGEIEARPADPALHEALRRDADDAVRETAAWALGEIEDRGAIESLAYAVANDRSTRVRGTAAWALGNLAEDSRRAPAGLTGLLGDDHADTRLKAAWALGEIGDPATAEAIERALSREQHTQVRRALVRALLHSGGRSQAAISELLNSRDPWARRSRRVRPVALAAAAPAAVPVIRGSNQTAPHAVEASGLPAHPFTPTPHTMRPFFPRSIGSVPLAVLASVALLADAGAQQTPPPAAPASATSHDQRPSALAARRTGAIAIDGRLDDAGWQAATPVTEFIQYDPNEGQPVSERTEARFVIDDDALYVGIRMFDSDPGAIQKQLARRDESIEGDLVEVYLDSYHDHNSAYLFRLSPAGARRDATLGANFNDASWDAVWDGKATVDAEGWSAEFRIPLSQLRYDPSRTEHVWGLQIGRKIARKGEVAFFAHTPKNEQGGVHRYGHLRGLGRLASPRRLEMTPYVLAKTENPVVTPGDPFRRQNQVVPGAGLDLKYGITSNLTLDATFNPDFGQVEVDPAVVNLSAFETFYPERRPFFVEGAGIFDFGSMRTNNSSNGYTFLHTRRIGRSPQRGIDGDDIDFVDAPQETTIAGAAKLTGRSAGGWSIGILDAVTAHERARFRTEDGLDHSAIVEPLTNYFAGRLKRDLRQGNTTIGTAVTAVNRELDEEPLVPLFRKSAYSAGLDWMHAWANRGWAFDGAIVYTTNRGSAESIQALQLSPARYYQRPDRDEVLYDPDRTSLSGHMAEVTFAKLSGKWRGSVTIQDYSPGFEINEAGFLGETDMRGIAPLISYSENTPNRFLRRWSHFLFWNPSWNYDGDPTFMGVGTINEGEFPNFWGYFLRADWRPRVYDSGLTRGGPVALLTTGGSWEAELFTDRRKRYQIGMYTNRSWNAAGGTGLNVSPSVTFRPSTAIRVSLSPSYSKTHAMAQYVTTVEDATVTDTYGSRYVFATLDQEQLSMVTRVDWTFTPALSLQVFAQPLVAAADFVDYKEFARPRDFAFEIYDPAQGQIVRDDATGTYTVHPTGTAGPQSFSFRDRDFNRRSLRGNAVLRWEYRPGSALFVVWQQSRFQQLQTGEFGMRRDLGELWGVRPENVFVVKGTFWVGR